MQQIINITEARNNLAQLVKQVKKTKQAVIIVQDSKPSVVISPYEEKLSHEKYLKRLLNVGAWDIMEDYKKIRADSRKRAKRLRL